MSEGQVKKRGLGMGLSALLGSDISETTQDSSRNGRSVPIAFLQPSALQPRRHFDHEELQSLAESIKQKGILQPLVVRTVGGMDHGYEIIAGERRWRAAQIAELHEVPIVIHELSDRDVLEVALIENLQRRDLSAVEEAEAYDSLIQAYGYTQEQVSSVIGKSRSHIANTLRLLKLPADVREMVLDGRLSAGHARALIGKDNASDLAAAIIEKGLSVREIEALMAAGAAVAKGAVRKPVPEKDPDLVDCEQRVAKQLGLRVDIKQKGNGGALTIRYSNGGQLDLLLQRLLSTP